MTLLTDIRYAVRSLSRQPAFTVVAAGTLALGIGATTAIFSVANGVLLRPLPYPGADRLVAVWEDDRTDPSGDLGGRVSGPNFRDIRDGSASFESMAQYDGAMLTLSGQGPAEVVAGGSVSPGFFQVFGMEPALGRGFTEEEGRYQGPTAVVLSDEFWRSHLGGRADVIGHTLTISGRSHPIVGVAPPGFAYPEGARLWVPIQNDETGCGRGCVIRSAIGRLAPAATLEGARAELEALASRLAADHPEPNANLALRASSLHDLTVGEVRAALWMLLAAVGMVLLIACSNVANLVLVRGGARRSEIAVRTALGARRGRILGQLMTENALLAALGGVAGVLLASWGVEALRRMAPPDLPRLDEVALDGTTLLFALGTAAATVVIFGFAPAARMARRGLADALRSSGRSGAADRQGRRARSLVLVLEVALSAVLLLGAGLMLRSVARMVQVDLGIETEGVVAFTLSLPQARYDGPDARVQFVERLEERLAAIPGVEAVATTVSLPFRPISLHAGFRRPELPEPEPGAGPTAGYRALDPDALGVLGVPVARGRGFEPGDRHDAEPVAMINQSAADAFWPGQDPIGRTMDLQISVGYPDDRPRRIVGITADFRSAVESPPHPEMYVPYAQAGASFPTLALATRGATPAAVLGAARQAVAALDPELPLIRPGTLDEAVAADMAARTFYLKLLALFAVLAVTLAAVGTYGLVAYLVVQRTREIGIRMALGAGVRGVVRMVVLHGLAPALAGVGLGLAAAVGLARYIGAILYDVPPTDPLTYLGAAMLLLAVVAAATAIPARRASRIPPAHALRAE